MAAGPFNLRIKKKKKKKKTEKENFVAKYRRNYNFTWFIWRKTFFQDFLRYTNKTQEFISIPYCLMDYCIPPYSAGFFFFFFFFFFCFLLNKALLVTVWNNLDSNSVEY